MSWQLEGVREEGRGQKGRKGGDRGGGREGDALPATKRKAMNTTAFKPFLGLYLRKKITNVHCTNFNCKYLVRYNSLFI
jgi:hypothetical protein